MSQDDPTGGTPPTGYGPVPAYGPPAYGPPGYPPPPGYGMRPPTNQLAIVALVLTFLGLLAPIGLVLGILARGQIRRTGEGGDGLALAAVVIGGIVTAMLLAGLLLWIFVLASIGSGSFTP